MSITGGGGLSPEGKGSEQQGTFGIHGISPYTLRSRTPLTTSSLSDNSSDNQENQRRKFPPATNPTHFPSLPVPGRNQTPRIEQPQLGQELSRDTGATDLLKASGEMQEKGTIPYRKSVSEVEAKKIALEKNQSSKVEGTLHDPEKVKKLEAPNIQGEGILPAQIDAVKSLTSSIEGNGAKAICVIAFGSRAKNEGIPESDLDAFFLLDFDAGDPTLLSDETLRRAKYYGQSITEKQGHAGIIHLFLYNEREFADKLLAYPDINSSPLFTGIASDGVILQGNEPVIEEKPLREYLRERLK